MPVRRTSRAANSMPIWRCSRWTATFPASTASATCPCCRLPGWRGTKPSVRAEGYPGYAVRPPGQRAWYAPITYLEPSSESNLLAFGYDIWSEAVRRAALEQARDTGQAAMTGKIQLVQDGGSAAGAWLPGRAARL